MWLCDAALADVLDTQPFSGLACGLLSRDRQGFIVDRVAQQPDPLDLDFTYIAGLHEQLGVSFKADTGWGSHHKDIAWMERHRFAQERDDAGHAVDHLAGISSLDDLPVESRGQLQPGAAGRNLVGRDEKWPEGSGAVEVLADGPLRSLHLEVAHRSIVEDRVADDVLQGVTLGDVAAALSDDRDQFALVVELFGHPGADKRGPVPGETGREPREYGGVGRDVIMGLPRLPTVVDTHTDDLARLAEQREVGD